MPNFASALASRSLISFNMQAAAHTGQFSHYVSKSWQHVLPSPAKQQVLQRIGALIQPFDFVGLQEADGGSVRSSFLHQAQQLQQMGNFSELVDQRNRKVGPWSCTGNSILARVAAASVSAHILPAAMGKRGALEAHFDGSRLINVHLALTPGAQQQQLQYLGQYLRAHPQPTLLFGDFNCTPDSAAVRALLAHTGYLSAHSAATFPSWAPKRCIDLVLHSPDVQMHSCAPLSAMASDHLPVACSFSLR